jgi:hypothetical protein
MAQIRSNRHPVVLAHHSSRYSQPIPSTVLLEVDRPYSSLFDDVSGISAIANGPLCFFHTEKERKSLPPTVCVGFDNVITVLRFLSPTARKAGQLERKQLRKAKLQIADRKKAQKSANASMCHYVAVHMQ